MKKIIMITTIPMSFATLVKGQAKYLSQYFEIKMVTSPSEKNEDISSYEGVKIHSVNMTRQITPIEDLKSLIKLFQYIKKEKPDAVYTFTPKAGLLGMMASFLARVPVRIHNIVGMPLMEVKGIKRKLLELIEKLTYFFATHLFCNSFGLKDYLYKNLTKKEVRVIANGSINGVDTDYFKNDKSICEQDEIRQEYGISPSDFVITFVGRIVKDKGINELVEVFLELSKKHDNLKLLLVGDYEEHLNSIDKKNKDLIDSSPSIIAVGFKKEIRNFLAITDLFALPSYREGLPNSLIEAGSFGIPLLATNINGCNEIIIQNETGILVNKKDNISLKNGLERMIVDTEQYNYIKKNIRTQIQERYSQDYFWQELRNEFESILEEKR